MKEHKEGSAGVWVSVHCMFVCVWMGSVCVCVSVCLSPLTTLLQRFVRVVPTVVVHVTLPVLWDAASVPTLELSWRAGAAGAVGVVLVRAVPTVVLPVTLPRLGDAPLVGTLPLAALTLVGG